MPLEKFPNWPPGHYDLDSLAKKITNLLSSTSYDGLVAEANTPLGQLVINNNVGESQISLDHDLAKLFGTGQIFPKMAIIKRLMIPTAYFVHCDLIDRNNNLFNGKRSDLLAKFDITGKPYQKVRYDTSL